MSLIVMDGWEKLFFLLYLIPVLSQGMQIVFLYIFVTQYSQLESTGDIVFGWSLVLYLTGAVVYFFISKASSKNELTSHIRNQRRLHDTALPYWGRVKNL